MSKSCTSCHEVKSKFSSKSSKTYKSFNRTVPLYYGLGNALGELSSETINIGGSQVKDQYFLMVIKDKDFENLKADGILGMGLGYSISNYPPLIFSMIEQKLIPEPNFSVFLADDESDLKSCVLFGESDLKKYAEKNSVFQYFKVLSDGYWSIKLDAIKVKGKPITKASFSIILDTGTSLIMGPDFEVNQVLKSINQDESCELKDSYWYCDCGDTEKYPKIEFVFDGKSFFIVPENYLLKSSSKCQVLLKPDKALNFWILGDVFLRRHYTLFDVENKRIGIVRSINEDKLIVSDNSLLTFIFWACVAGIVAIVFYIAWGAWSKRRNNRRVNFDSALINMTEMSEK